MTDGALTATDSKTTIVDTPPEHPTVSHFTIGNQTTGQQFVSSGDPFTGPVSGIDWQLIDITPDKLNITSQVPNVFIHSGFGDDAIDVSANGGHNILDGSTGSNFLTGSSGTDEFYVDARSIPQTSPGQTGIWSTVVGMHPGDVATVWGVTKADFTITTADNLGAVGKTGLTWDFAGPNGTDAKLTLAGFGSADMNKLSVNFGRSADLPNLPGSNFMQIVDHS